MYYTLVHPLTNKSIFYRVDVINDGFLVTCKYKGKNIKAIYSNYSNISVTIDEINISNFIDIVNYNFNNIEEIFKAVDNIIYNKLLKIKIIYLTKYISRLTNQDVSYILEYLY